MARVTFPLLDHFSFGDLAASKACAGVLIVATGVSSSSAIHERDSLHTCLLDAYRRVVAMSKSLYLVRSLARAPTQAWPSWTCPAFDQLLFVLQTSERAPSCAQIALDEAVCGCQGESTVSGMASFSLPGYLSGRGTYAPRTM